METTLKDLKLIRLHIRCKDTFHNRHDGDRHI